MDQQKRFCEVEPGMLTLELPLTLPELTRTDPNVKQYGPETLLGNWFEDISKKRIECEEYCLKKQCNQLLSQASQTMVNDLCRPTVLKSGSEEVLRFGDKVQIVQPGPDCCAAQADFPLKNRCATRPVVLSASVPPSVIDCRPWLDVTSLISASIDTCPVMRNTFIIEHPDCPSSTQVLHYGDTFRLRALDGCHKHALWLHSAPACKFETMAIHSGKPAVRLSDCKNANTLWSTYPVVKELIMRVPFGIPVTRDSLLLMKHAVSGISLSVEHDFPVLTYFGCDKEVTVNTKLTGHRKVSWENYWILATSKSEDASVHCEPSSGSTPDASCQKDQ